MKGIKRIAVLLACVLCIGFTACAKKSDTPSGPNDPDDPNGLPIVTPINPIEDKQQHYVTGNLHKVNVTPTARAFVTNGESAYKIVVGTENAIVTEAARFLQKQVRKATGAMLPIVTYSSALAYNANAEYIVLECDELFAAAGLTMPTDDIGATGYYVKSVGKSVFMQTKGVYGYQNSVIAFLRGVLGYEMYSADIVTFENKGETLPDLDIIERPDFEFHVTSQPVPAEAEYGMGFMSRNDLFISVEGHDQHNSMDYLPPETYNDPDNADTYHPKWYSTIQRDKEKQQLCYNARGDEDEYKAMVDAVTAKMITLLTENPDISNIGFTQQDGDLDCGCDTCKSMNGDDKFGSAGYSAGIVKLCNAVYNKSFYDEDNASEAAKLDGWAACSDKIFYWLYETNYSCYLFPYNSYDTIIETYRYCYNNGAKYMYSEGQHNQPIVTHFTKLKEYLNAKAMFNVNVNFKDVADDFFANYFREASVPMRQFFDEMQAQLRYIEKAYPEDVRGSIFDEVEDAKFWPKRTVDRWVGLIEEAYAAIEPYKIRDPELYEVLYNNILLESIFPRFAQIHLHSGYYGAEELRQMRIAFRADAQKLGITRYDENAPIDSVFTSWNI